MMMAMTRRETTAIEMGRAAFRAELDAAKVAPETFDAFQAKASGAFGRVQNEDNWKAPVDAVIACAPRHLGFLLEAVVFLTGSVPSFDKVAPGRYRVRAIGYYAAIGA